MAGLTAISVVFEYNRSQFSMIFHVLFELLSILGKIFAYVTEEECSFPIVKEFFESVQ